MGQKVSRSGEEEKAIMFGLDWNAYGRKICLKKRGYFGQGYSILLHISLSLS